MRETHGYAATAAGAALVPYKFFRREPGPHDVLIRILYCGICHSDIHQARDEWGGALFPMVPGHEIVGTVAEVGSEVRSLRVGDRVGVGCFVGSCRECPSCRQGLEQYCEGHLALTYNGTERDGTPTYGGYSDQIVVDENYVLRIPDGLPLERAAPLLCAGITTYSPLRHWKVGKGHKLAVIGLGGLGHMAVQIGAALGAEVTVLSHSASKRADAERLGAAEFIVAPEVECWERWQRRFDFLLDTVSAPEPLDSYLELLKTDGTMILVGAPSQPISCNAFSLLLRRRQLVGSLIGGIRETQEMLEFCAEHGIAAQVEVIPIQKVNEAYERVVKGDVRYRFVIDLDSLNQ